MTLPQESSETTDKTRSTFQGNCDIELRVFEARLPEKLSSGQIRERKNPDFNHVVTADATLPAI